MSTVKISALPKISTFAGANTGNILFLGVDLSDNVTGQINGTALANNLYLNNNLVVGNNTIVLPNTIAQFSGNVNSYMQINSQNFNSYGTTDIILTADDGTDTLGFVDFGINNSQWNPATNQQTSQYAHDAYLIVQGVNATATGNLVIGTANPGANVVFAVGGYQSNNIVAVVAANGIVMNTNTFITFSDGTVLSSAKSSAYTNAAYAQANTAVAGFVAVATFLNSTANTANSAASFANGAFTAANNATTLQSGINTTQNTSIQYAWSTANGAFLEANSASAWANGVNASQNTNINAAFAQANLANSIANTAVQNTASITLTNLTLAGNLIPASSNLYSLGSPTLKWGNLYLGPNTIFLTDTVTGNVANLVLQNGFLNINGATALGAGNTTIYANGTIVSPNVIVTGSETANTVVANSFIYNSLTTTTAVQTGSRTTLVYASGTSGVIVAYNASTFQHGTSYVFTVNNSSILHASDIVIISVQSTNCPVLQATTANTRVGSFDILVTNGSNAGNDAAYTMNLNFGIIRVGS